MNKDNKRKIDGVIMIFSMFVSFGIAAFLFVFLYNFKNKFQLNLVNSEDVLFFGPSFFGVILFYLSCFVLGIILISSFMSIAGRFVRRKKDEKINAFYYVKENIKWILGGLIISFILFSISFGSYNYATEDNFIYVLSFYKKEFNIKEIESVKIELHQSYKRKRKISRRLILNFNYYIIFNNGKRVDLATNSGMYDSRDVDSINSVAELDNFLKSINVEMDYSEVESKTVNHALKSSNSEYIRNVKSIFLKNN